MAFPRRRDAAKGESSGKTIGDFVIEAELGSGGMGVVLLGQQKNLERPAVLKKLRRDLAANPEFVERFRREARSAAAVHHQNVVAVYDCFDFRRDHYIALEYVDGVDLGGALERVPRIPARIAMLIALEVARGLQAIHANGTVHRDLKPANILLGRSGEVKIADFGIAQEAAVDGLTQPGVLIGSPPYMPPEQMLGERVDSRGDVFSFGVVLYEMLAGEAPYPERGGDGVDTILARMQRERYPRLRRRARDVPRSLARLVRGCLRSRPRQRPQSAVALREALERRLRRPSPERCREEIRHWLWERRVFEARDGETILVRDRPRVVSPRRSRLAWAGVAAVLVAVAGPGLFLGVEETGRALRETHDSMRALARRMMPAAAGEARVQLDLPEGAQVQLDEGPLMDAGDAGTLVLPPGRYRIRVLHPERGEWERQVDLQAGDSLRLEPEFGGS